MGQAKPRVVVAGGSLGGLTAALTLRDAGCDVTVIERSRTALIGLGAGIVLNPATVRYLTQQPDFDLSAISIATQCVRYMDDDGGVLHQRPCRYRFSSYNALYQALLQRLDAHQYHLNTALSSLEQNENGVTAQLADGRALRCDLLVCADGIRSTARRVLCPGLVPSYAGYVAFRGTVKRDEIGAATFAQLSDAITYRILPQSHLLTYPIPFADPASGMTETQMNWLWYCNVPPGEPLDVLMTDRDGTRRDLSLPPGMMQPAHVVALRADAERLPPPLREVVQATAKPFVQVIVDLEMPRMVFGKVCLIGDAGFVARPHAAAGTAKAAEDAWTLAAAMRATDGDVSRALQAWEPPQLALGRAVLARTREAGRRSQVAGDWQVGDLLPFGLHAVGDSEMA